jgi:protein-S-isoprenylcysteine O-methyltransferase Ste14
MYLPTHPPVTLATSILLTWFFSTAGPHTFIIPTYLRLGILLFWIIAFILIITAFRELRKKKTTIIPTGKPTALAIAGPYRLTRNPIYVGYFLIAFGVAWYFGSLTGFIGPLYFFWLVNGSVIPLEELNLRQAIGPAYGEYLLNTKRWL